MISKEENRKNRDQVLKFLNGEIPDFTEELLQNIVDYIGADLTYKDINTILELNGIHYPFTLKDLVENNEKYEQVMSLERIEGKRKQFFLSIKSFAERPTFRQNDYVKDLLSKLRNAVETTYQTTELTRNSMESLKDLVTMSKSEQIDLLSYIPMEKDVYKNLIQLSKDLDLNYEVNNFIVNQRIAVLKIQDIDRLKYPDSFIAYCKQDYQKDVQDHIYECEYSNYQENKIDDLKKDLPNDIITMLKNTVTTVRERGFYNQQKIDALRTSDMKNPTFLEKIKEKVIETFSDR